MRASLAEAEKQAPPPTNSAAEYIQSVLAREPLTPSSARGEPQMAKRSLTVRSAVPRAPGLRRENWERIVVIADVELHVRRPLSREMNRRIERLLAAARQILTDQPAGGEEQ